MTPGTYHLPGLVEGDTWTGVPSLRVRVNDAAPPSALALVRLQVRRRHDDAVAMLSLTSADGGIVIGDAAEWELSIPPRQIALAAGRYVYDLEFTDAAGTVKTYLAGTMVVHKQVTR